MSRAEDKKLWVNNILTSDNYPGSPGAGPAAAKKMLDKYETLEEIYKNLEDPELFLD